MKNIILSLIALILIVFSSEVVNAQEQIINNTPYEASNFTSTYQIGEYNYADVNQRNIGGVQHIEVIQNGNSNELLIIQEGLENSISTVQEGSFNNMDINVDGEGNEFGYLQIGNSNYIEHTTYLNDGSGKITQSGDNNSVRLNEMGGNYLNGVSISQTGNMEVTITTSLVLR